MADWKIKMDPFIGEIYEDGGMDAVKKTGYFIDDTSSPDDIDYMLDVPTTPLGWADSSCPSPAVLICAGSFCPPHTGHVDMMRAARRAVEKAGRQVVAGYFSPGHDEYIKHKNGDGAIPVHERIKLFDGMLDDWMYVCPWEGVFNKHAIMFTHVVERLGLYIKRHTGLDIPVYFVCGSDNENYVFAFMKRGQCVLVNRPGYKLKIPQSEWPINTLWADCENSSSSTEERLTYQRKVAESRLYLRVEDSMYESMGVDYSDLEANITKRFTNSKISFLSTQEHHIRTMRKLHRIISLDALIRGDENIRVSRHYDFFGRDMIRFAASPEALSLREQISGLEGKYLLYDDDIHTTGGTIRYMTKLLESVGCDIEGVFTFKVSDDSEGEILDLRDFFIGTESGLVVQSPHGKKFRAPYMYPYVCPYSRASIQDPMKFSIEMWELNLRIYEDMPTKVGDLRAMGELFVYSGLAKSDDTVAAACRNHIKLLEKLL
jgi:nicotinic acid mononucleotide adenylyltransferase